MGLPSLDTMLYETSFLSFCTERSPKLRPMRRLTSYTVRSGLDVAWFFAESPVRRSLSVNPTHEDVVPRSMPMTVPMFSSAASSARAKNAPAPSARAPTRATVAGGGQEAGRPRQPRPERGAWPGSWEAGGEGGVLQLIP